MAESAEQRFRSIYEQHVPAVYRFFLRRVEEEGSAQDCTADTFLVAWRRLDDVPDGDHALPWLYGVARHVLQNHYRSNTRSRRLLLRLGWLRREQSPTPEGIVLRRSEDREVVEALHRIRPEDQEVLRLSVWEELTNPEIGELLGCSAHAVAQRRLRATRRLARQLGGAGNPPTCNGRRLGMTRNDRILERLRAANPAPGEARIDPREISTISSLLAERRSAVTTQTPIRPRVPSTNERRWLRPALAFGLTLVVIVIAIGMGMFLLGGGEEDVIEPSQTTLPTPTTAPAPPTTPTADSTSTSITTAGQTTPSLTWVQAQLPGRHARLVGTGPGQIFASVDEVLYVSTTGSDWTAVEGLPGSLTILEIAHGGGTYLVAGREYPAQELIMYGSEDLTSWVQVKQPPPGFSGIAYGDGLFVAVGEDATMSGSGDTIGIESIHAGVWVSSDGYDWSLIIDDSSVFEGLYREDAWVEPQDVAFGPSGFVMVGQDDYSSDWVTGVAWHSPDGLSWTRSSGDFESSGGDSGLYSVTSGEAGYLATGILDPYASAIWFSSNGTAWERTAFADASVIDAIAIEVGYLAVGEATVDGTTTGVVYFSADGRDWDRLPGMQPSSTDSETWFLRRAATTDTLVLAAGYRELPAEDPPPNDPQAQNEYVETIWYAPLP